MPALSNFQALSFDCYGTLIDWESGIWDALQPVILENDRTDITRNQALGVFATAETQLERDQPTLLYPTLLDQVHQRIAEHYQLHTRPELNERFGQSVPHWPAFPDSADALRVLKKHFKLVILSNVHRAGFVASNQKLGVHFDAVYTAEDIGSYKPNPANFDYLLKRIKADLDIDAPALLHTAQSLHHDHVPATRAGLKKAWIDRQNLANGESWGATAVVPVRPEVDYHFATLAEMANAVAACD